MLTADADADKENILYSTTEHDKGTTEQLTKGATEEYRGHTSTQRQTKREHSNEIYFSRDKLITLSQWCNLVDHKTMPFVHTQKGRL